MNVTTRRVPRCRVLDSHSNPCPNPALVEDAEILLCSKHLARAGRLWNQVKAAAIASVNAA